MATTVPTQRPTAPAAAQPPQLAAAQTFTKLTIEGIKPLLVELQQNLLAELGAIRVSLSSIEARLSEREVATKRPPRPSKVTGAATAIGTPKEAVGGDALKPPSNVMFFCRFQWALDASFRERYTTPHIRTLLLNHPKVLAQPEGQKRLLAEGNLVWKEGLTEDKKKEVRDEYKRWQTQNVVSGIPAPLEIENDENYEFRGVLPEELEYQDENVL